MKRRLDYEALVADHAQSLFAILADARVWRHLDAPDSATVEELAAEFARRASGPPPGRSDERWVNFAVRLADDGPYVGRIEATVHGPWAEIAYLFGPAHWDRGLATEAVGWLREHLRDRFGVEELWAATRKDNLRSLRLLARLGFVAAAPLRPLLSADDGDVLMCWIATPTLES